jgi:hypothetical protein
MAATVTHQKSPDHFFSDLRGPDKPDQLRSSLDIDIHTGKCSSLVYEPGNASWLMFLKIHSYTAEQLASALAQWLTAYPYCFTQDSTEVFRVLT